MAETKKECGSWIWDVVMDETNCLRDTSILVTDAKDVEERLWRMRLVPLPETEREFVEYMDTGRLIIPSDRKIDGLVDEGKGPVEGRDDITGLPPFFRIRLISHHEPGTHAISEVWLPKYWNGRLIGAGNGGLAGKLSFGTLADFVWHGYACVHMDMGTSSGETAGCYAPGVIKDYGWRATHEATVCAKILVRACYGRDPIRSYFYGNSTGGQQAMCEAQRFPEDYDGIYAGVPAFSRTGLHTYHHWIVTSLHGKDGNLLFTDEDMKKLRILGLRYFKEHGDGGEADDAFITYPYHGEDTIPSFLAFVKKELPDLTDEQLSALADLYSGPKDPVTGEQIYCGVPIGSDSPGRTVLPMARGTYPNYVILWGCGRNAKHLDFDFHKDALALHDNASADLSAVDPDLRPFFARGGKLLSFSGTADLAVPYPESMSYYERVCAVCGKEETLASFRYFLLPGRAHGEGGIGTDDLMDETDKRRNALLSLIYWVEEGKAPDRLVAHSGNNPNLPGKKPFDRFVYPYGTENFPFCPHPASASERFL